MSLYFRICTTSAVLCFLAGCYSTIIDKYSYPVSQGYPDYGAIPDQLPRYVNGLPDWARSWVRDIDNFGVGTWVHMSNSIYMQDGQLMPSDSRLRINGPLVIKTDIYVSNKDGKFILSNVLGKLTLASGKSMAATKVYLEGIPCGFGPSRSGRYYIDEKNIYFDYSEARNATNEERSGKLVTPYTCLVFEYPEPVSVDSIFKVYFGKVTLGDGKVIPFEAQFYPMVKKYHGH
ncbi:MAG: hypothetical protein LBQ20_07180 [Rhodanobacter sp.]|jgi:hypothetical protein|nr:hypothetical protein [Rhodanobacter sp.]